MKNKEWKNIHTFFDQMHNFILTYKKELVKDDFDKPDITDKQVEAQNVVKEEDIVQIRIFFREKLELLKTQLSEQLSERDTYFIFLAIVAYVDEYVQTSFLKGHPIDWPPIQEELLEIENAGDEFFEILDDLLRDPRTLPLIFEVYYFILIHGFKGKYAHNSIKINDYLIHVKSKIHTDMKKNPIKDDDSLLLMPKQRSFKYYLIAAAVVVVSYLILIILQSFYN